MANAFEARRLEALLLARSNPFTVDEAYSVLDAADELKVDPQTAADMLARGLLWDVQMRGACPA